jgi:hypothetical protein
MINSLGYGPATAIAGKIKSIEYFSDLISLGANFTILLQLQQSCYTVDCRNITLHLPVALIYGNIDTGYKSVGLFDERAIRLSGIGKSNSRVA